MAPSEYNKAPNIQLSKYLALRCSTGGSLCPQHGLNMSVSVRRTIERALIVPYKPATAKVTVSGL
jgi:hypothetical protein